MVADRVMWRLVLQEGAYAARTAGPGHIRRNATEDVHPGVDFPFAVDEGLGGERAQGGLVQLGEQLAPAGAVQAHRAGVEIAE